MTSLQGDNRISNRLQDRENDRLQGRSDHESAATWRPQNDQVIARILCTKGNKQKLLLSSANITTEQFVDGDDEKSEDLNRRTPTCSESICCKSLAVQLPPRMRAEKK